MRKTYFYMAFLALAFGISGCGDITYKEGESFCGDDTTMMLCKRGELTFSNCPSGCNFDTGKCKGSSDSPQEPGSDSPQEPVECPDNPYKCKGQDVSQECLNGEWISYTCEDGCDTQTGKCKACIEGSFKCADNHNLYSCKDGHWGPEKYCANGCNTSTGKCNANNGGNDNSGGNNGSTPECTSGSYKCEGNSSYYCNGGYWQKESCVNGCHTSTGKCNACPTGKYECEDDTSYYCDGTSWQKESCVNGCHTSTGKCNACPTGEYRCEGNFSSFCDGTSWRKESCENGCHPSTGKCISCTTDGKYKCEIKQVYMCIEGGWELLDGICHSELNSCTDGEYICDGNASYVCHEDHWYLVRNCFEGCNYNTQRCYDAYTENCTFGSFKCQDSDSYFCKADGWGLVWDLYEVCASGCNEYTGKCHTSGTTDPTPDDGAAIANWTSFSNELKKEHLVAGISADEGSADTTAKLRWVGNNKDGSIAINGDNKRIKFANNDRGGRGNVATENSYLEISYAALSRAATLTLKIETRGSIYVFTDSNDRKLTSTPAEITTSANNPADFTVTLSARSTSVRLYNAEPTAKAVYISSIVIQ